MLDIPNIGFGDHFLCSSGICESILWLRLKSSICIVSFSSECSNANREVYGSISTKQINFSSRNKMVTFIEPRALQSKRACPDHHICQFRIKFCLCCECYYHCEGILSVGDTSTSSYAVNTNNPGQPLLNFISLYLI